MAQCVECGTKKNLDYGAERCRVCQAAKNAFDARRQNEPAAPRPAPIDPKLCVTTLSIPGYDVMESMGVVTAECAFGMNIFRDFFAGMSDVFGGRSGSTQSVLRDARDTCLKELRTAAAEQGANAVVGIDLDYSEFSGGGKSMLFLVASGTAVLADRMNVEQTSRTL